MAFSFSFLEGEGDRKEEKRENKLMEQNRYKDITADICAML
jgi:hypothetical protein